MKEPVFIELDALSLSGFQGSFEMGSPDTPKGIGDLWRRLHGALPDGLGKVSYGVCEMTGPSRFTYTAAVPIALAAAEGVATVSVPGGRYAQFTHEGPVTRIHETYQAGHGWLQQKGLPLRSGPDLERYDERFKDDNDGEFDILIPVVQVARPSA